jgi:alanyl-tRNA synthetase
MNAQAIRQAYLSFFIKQNHKKIKRTKLIPDNDASTLFTGSGMQPLIAYLLGEVHPDGNRLTDSQTCLRAQDIEEVGDNRHTTFFEMLGNWSLGDYFKKQQIPWLFEFLTEVIKLDPNKLYISCYQGNQQLGIDRDNESAEIWRQLFTQKAIKAEIKQIGSESDGYDKGMLPNERIFFYDGQKNWWSRNGAEATTPVGDPCGPDSEVFYLFDNIKHDKKWGEKCHPNCDCGRFIEIANSVFMSYKRTDAGFEPLKKPNVDFGGGLERLAMAVNNDPDVFKISLLQPIITKLEQLSNKSYETNSQSMRVIADHLRAATFLAVDGVRPSNKAQGYVMRRLVRRAIRFAFDLGIEQNFLNNVLPVITDIYSNDFPEVHEAKDEVIEVLIKEEKVFRQTLRNGIKELRKMAYLADGTHAKIVPPQKEPIPIEPYNLQIDGRAIFKLYDTYGFPVELALEEATLQGIRVADYWQDDFNKLMEEQKKRSQTATKGVFKGGLAGDSLIHKKYHTATHLMYQALRQVLGDHVVQRGSNITNERLRFDFSHHQKMTEKEIKLVEEIVNQQIDNNLKVSYKEYPTKEALSLGALGQFGDRYGETVKVYKMIAKNASKPFSFEICGGPHVDQTAQLSEGGKRFKIIKEEASSAGVRRIKAVLI